MFKVGEKRHPNAGRKKGTPNKISLRVFDQLTELGISPLMEALKILRDPDANLSHDRRFDGWMRLMSYCYPQLKAIEISGEIEGAGVSVTAENVALLCRIAREATLPAKDEAS